MPGALYRSRTSARFVTCHSPSRLLTLHSKCAGADPQARASAPGGAEPPREAHDAHHLLRHERDDVGRAQGLQALGGGHPGRPAHQVQGDQGPEEEHHGGTCAILCSSERPEPYVERSGISLLFKQSSPLQRGSETLSSADPGLQLPTLPTRTQGTALQLHHLLVLLMLTTCSRVQVENFLAPDRERSAPRNWWTEPPPFPPGHPLAANASETSETSAESEPGLCAGGELPGARQGAQCTQELVD